MEEKNNSISDYITQISEQINKQYPGLMSEDKIERAIEMFKDSPEQYENIVKRINELAQQVIQNYLKEQEKRFNPELVKQNHEEIYENYNCNIFATIAYIVKKWEKGNSKIEKLLKVYENYEENELVNVLLKTI